ncbi:MAG: NUDIX domain-containing protein [Clostridia bacterium]|nr:NUDIX domain-containing protein [Clostridia bacterium]
MDSWLETREMPAHIVSAAGLVWKEGRVLLIRSARRGWEWPGGVVEPGEDLCSALKREIWEESGVQAEPVRLAAVYQNLCGKAGYGPLAGLTLPPTVNLAFQCAYVSGEPSVTPESLESGWFTPEEARERVTYPLFAQVLTHLLAPREGVRFMAFRKREENVTLVHDALLPPADVGKP